MLKLKVPEMSCGHCAGTIEKAVEALRATGAKGRIVAQAVRAYAWPLLWLRYRMPEREAVVFADPGGALQVFPPGEAS